MDNLSFKEKFDALNAEYTERKRMVVRCKRNIEQLIFEELIWLKNELIESDAFDLFHKKYVDEDVTHYDEYTTLYDMIRQFNCYSDFEKSNRNIRVNYDDDYFQLYEYIGSEYYIGSGDYNRFTDFFPYEIFDREIIKTLKDSASSKKERTIDILNNIVETYTDIISDYEFNFGKGVSLTYNVDLDENHQSDIININMINLDGEKEIVGEIKLNKFIKLIKGKIEPTDVISGVIPFSVDDNPLKYSQCIQVLLMVFRECVKHRDKLSRIL